MPIAAWFEDYSVGDRIASPTRAIERDDVKNYSRFTNDVRPVMDGDDESPGFVPPLYLFSLGVGLLLHAPQVYIPEHFVAFFGFDTIRFPRPAPIGIVVRSEADVIALTSRGRNGLVEYDHRTIGADGEIYASSRQRILVKKADPA